MSRRKIATIVVATVVVSALGGWAAASRIRSPAEAAARTAPPEASTILVPAEDRVLSTDVVTRGTARFGSPQKLTVTPSALKPDAGLVTKTSDVGAELVEGDVVLTATGRPVFLLAGDRLGVRDLGPGLEGEDVRQVEGALDRLGFGPGPVDGLFDGSTEAAVLRWYEASGFAPFRATEDQLATIRSREADLATARIDLHTADEGVATATAELSAAIAVRIDAMTTQTVNPTSMASARAEADAVYQAAQADVAVKAAALDELLAGGRPSRSSVAAARAELAAARTSAVAAQRTGDSMVAAAVAAARVADNAVGSAQAAVDAARQKLAIAEAAVGDQGVFTRLAAQEAGLAQRRAGIQVPADEMVFVPTTPVRVSELLLTPGDQLTGPVMAATDSVVAVDGSLALEDARLVTAGATVNIDEPDLGIKAVGTVRLVADKAGTNGVDGFHIWFEVAVGDAPPNLVGASVRLTVPVTSTSGSVLAVPTSAVWMTADGSSQVERDDGGERTFVRVEPGLAAKGFVEVRPIDGALRPGDLVVVGTDQAGGGPNG